MRKDIYNYVDNCQKCAETKGSTHSPAPMLNYPVPDGPWKRVHIDTLELSVSENGFRYLFVAIDYFSRFCILQPIINKKAETIASVIYSHIIADFTTPWTIITDNGTKFKNIILEELCKLFHVKKVNVQAYHHQSNGVVERLNRKILICLRALINPYSIEWDKWIPTVKCALNTQVNSATGDSPHYIIFGEDKLLPYDLLSAEPQPVYTYDDYIATNINEFQLIHRRVRDHRKAYKEDLVKQQHKVSRKVDFNVGKFSDS